MKAVFSILKILLTLLYPILVFISLQSGISLRLVSLLLILMLALHLNGKLRAGQWFLTVGVGILVVLLWISNEPVFLKLYPILVNLSLLAVFGLSLRSPVCIVEKFARLQDKNLDPSAVAYCRRVTVVWCVFFILNAFISAYTLTLPDLFWVWYNGLISYILMGLLMAVEYLVRRRVQRAQRGEYASR